MNSLMRCVLITSRQKQVDLDSHLPTGGLPNLEIIHANQDDLAEWFTPGGAVPSVNRHKMPEGTARSIADEVEASEEIASV